MSADNLKDWYDIKVVELEDGGFEIRVDDDLGMGNYLFNDFIIEVFMGKLISIKKQKTKI